MGERGESDRIIPCRDAIHRVSNSFLRFMRLKSNNPKGRAGTPTRPFQILFQHGLSDDNLCRNLVFVVLHGHDVEACSEIVAEAFSAVALDFG